jgi:hypothetical protein
MVRPAQRPRKLLKPWMTAPDAAAALLGFRDDAGVTDPGELARRTGFTRRQVRALLALAHAPNAEFIAAEWSGMTVEACERQYA